MLKLYFVLSLKRRCYGYPLILGASNKCRSALFALAFQNKLQYHYLGLNARDNR